LGKLIAEEYCHNYAFSELCDCIEEHEKSPLRNGISRFIGLENIETDNFTIQGFGNVEDGTTFSKKFKHGDVLFGKRRAYLRKVAVADFDGICSGDILVFRAKREIVVKELLPYYVASEKFFQHAINTSAGSLSPRTKWRDLSRQVFTLPDMETQEKILDLLIHLEKTLFLVEQQITNLKSLKQELLNSIFA